MFYRKNTIFIFSSHVKWIVAKLSNTDSNFRTGVLSSWGRNPMQTLNCIWSLKICRAAKYGYCVHDVLAIKEQCPVTSDNAIDLRQHQTRYLLYLWHFQYKREVTDFHRIQSFSWVSIFAAFCWIFFLENVREKLAKILQIYSIV